MGGSPPHRLDSSILSSLISCRMGALSDDVKPWVEARRPPSYEASRGAAFLDAGAAPPHFDSKVGSSPMTSGDFPSVMLPTFSNSSEFCIDTSLHQKGQQQRQESQSSNESSWSLASTRLSGMETFSVQSTQSTGCHGGSVVHELSDPPPGLTAPALPTACWATSAKAGSRKVPLSPARSGACWAGNVNDNTSVVPSVAADFSNEVPWPTFARVQGMFPKIKEEPKHPTLERPTPEWSNASQPTAGRSATVQLHPDRAEMMRLFLEAAQRLEAQASASALQFQIAPKSKRTVVKATQQMQRPTREEFRPYSTNQGQEDVDEQSETPSTWRTLTSLSNHSARVNAGCSFAPSTSSKVPQHQGPISDKGNPSSMPLACCIDLGVLVRVGAPPLTS